MSLPTIVSTSGFEPLNPVAPSRSQSLTPSDISTVSDNLPTVAELIAESNRGCRLNTADLDHGSVPASIDTDPTSTDVLDNEDEDADISQWGWLIKKIDSILSEDIDAATECRLNQQLKSAQDKLNKLARVIAVNVTCGLCSRIMERVYTIPCGHSYCGTCIRSAAEAKLEERLKSLADYKGVRRSTFGPIPNSADQKARLIQFIKIYDSSTDHRDYFKYYCPRFTCKKKYSQPPVETYEHGKINMKLAGTMADHFEIGPSNVASAGGQGYFAGIF